VEEHNQNDSVRGEAEEASGSSASVEGGPNLLDKIIATGLGTGLSPFAPGTVGSLLAFLIYFIPGFHETFIMLPAILIFFAWGTLAADRMEKAYGHDPSRVVIDEIVALWISLLFLPHRLLLALMAFVIFRVLDIFKPFPANYFDRRDRGISIMMDDVVCGVYTNIILQLYLFFGK
jgi:phosphatidylglycerophosphatase A